MSSIPQDAQQIEAMGSSVDFFKTVQDGVSTYYFDTSKCGPPAPMVNAMAGLQLLEENSKLVMINHKSPGGLFPKIQDDYNYEVEDLADGNVKVVFTKKSNGAGTTNYNDNKCSG
ncbi:MAG: hypothetical protein L3I99_03075 [Sulfurimonas sp.]|nr:hypothetical protein [Sulfurimonas sp.]